MRTIIPILILIVFSAGIGCIISCFVTQMSLVTKLSVAVSGLVNVLLAIEFIKSIAIHNGVVEEEQED